LEQNKVATKSTAAEQAKKEFERVELDAAVDESLGDDDLWNDLVTENAVPAIVIKGIRIPQPTKEQVDEWSKRANEPDSDTILMGADVYAKLQEAFRPLPISAYRNFQKRFMAHMFGLDDGGELGK